MGIAKIYFLKGTVKWQERGGDGMSGINRQAFKISSRICSAALSPVKTLTMCDVEGGKGVALEIFYTLYGTDSDTKNCLTTPGQKHSRGGGLRNKNSCREVLFQATFKTERF